MSCCVTWDVDGDVDVYHENQRRARKPHACLDCGNGIEPRTTYYRCSCLYDGSWSDWAQCEGCHARRSQLRDHRIDQPPAGELYSTEPLRWCYGGPSPRDDERCHREFGAFAGLVLRWRLEDAA